VNGKLGAGLMAPTNIIVNGDFAAGDANWSGNDIEADYSESAYIGANPGNTVAEMDGASGQTTVMEQSITISGAMTTTLTFDTALRTASNGDAGSEGYTVEILDSSNNVVATQDYYPTDNVLSGESLDVTFPSGGTYTVRFTELGPDNSLGAIVDNISMLVCFVDGTKIRTKHGLVPVETLKIGDMIWTLDDGYQPIRWINSRKITKDEQRADARLRPVRIRQTPENTAMGYKDLLVSPHHRILRGGQAVELLFGAEQVLACAKDLCDDKRIFQETPDQDRTYVHFMFDAHQIVESNGLLSESFYAGQAAIEGLGHSTREELFLIFPELRETHATACATARSVLRGFEAQVLAGF
jgi:hypothetical protein